MSSVTVAERSGEFIKKLTDTNKHETAAAIGQIALGFVVPFAVQVGMGATVEAGAMRAGLQGLLGGVAVGGGLLGRLYMKPSKLHDYYDMLQPLGVAAIYAAGNDVMALSKSQGPIKDFTFSAVSGYATLGLQPLSARAIHFFMDEKADAVKAASSASSSAAKTD